MGRHAARGSLAGMKGTTKRIAVFALLLALPACDDGNRYEFLVFADRGILRCDLRTGEVWQMPPSAPKPKTWDLLCK